MLHNCLHCMICFGLIGLRSRYQRSTNSCGTLSISCCFFGTTAISCRFLFVVSFYFLKQGLAVFSRLSLNLWSSSLFSAGITGVCHLAHICCFTCIRHYCVLGVTVAYAEWHGICLVLWPVLYPALFSHWEYSPPGNIIGFHLLQVHWNFNMVCGKYLGERLLSPVMSYIA
jgi:hypothetical protein